MMKTKLFLLAIAIITLQLFPAQKKAIKKSAPSPETNTSLLYQMLGTDINDALLQLDDKFSSAGIASEKIEDNVNYVLDDNHKKTEAISGFEKNVTFRKNDKSLVIILKSDENKKINTVKAYSDPALDTEIKQLMGIEKWSLTESKGINIYKEKNKTAIASNNSLTAFIDTKLENVADRCQKLKGGNLLPFFMFRSQDYADYLCVSIMPLVNSSLIAVSDNNVFFEDGNFLADTQAYYYKNGFVAVITESKNDIRTKIYNNSKIALNNLMSKLQDAGYKEKYREAVDGGIFFQNTKDAMIKQTQDFLEVYALPDNNEGGQNTSYMGQQEITPNLLNSIYENFPNQNIRNQFIKDHFNALDNEDGTYRFFGMDEKFNKIRCNIFPTEKFNEYWGAKFDISFTDQSALNTMNTDLNESLLAVINNLREDYYKVGSTYYDKNVYSANKTSQEMQENANRLAEQKAEAERKQREIEENQRKAQRNAELSQGLQQITNELLKLKKN